MNDNSGPLLWLYTVLILKSKVFISLDGAYATFPYSKIGCTHTDQHLLLCHKITFLAKSVVCACNFSWLSNTIPRYYSSFSYLSYGLNVTFVDKVRIRSANVHRFTLGVLKEIYHLPDQVIRLSKSECRQ